MEEKKRTFIAINKAFVKTGLPSKKHAEKTYNLATLPKGTIIGGMDMSGYVFYPLYVNEAKTNERIYTIPYLSDTEIYLFKDGISVTVSPKELRDGLNESYKQYLQEQEELEKQENIELEYEWEEKSFTQYIRDYVDERLEELKGIQCYGGDLSLEITQKDGQEGTIAADTKEASQFIRTHFDEAKLTHDWLKEKEELSQPSINPFDDPDLFHLSMVDMGVETLMETSDYLHEHKNEVLTLDANTLKAIRKDLGIGKSRSLGKTLYQEQDMNMEIE